MARTPVHWSPPSARQRFRETEIVLEDGRPHGQQMDPWQRADFEALDDPRHQHAYLERPRGHSKTGDVGTECVTELVLGPAGRQLYAAAADEDQARLLLEDVTGKFQRNPRLAPLATLKKNQIVMKRGKSTLTILAADAPSSYGLRPDLIVVDELAEWKKRDLWDSLWTATGKRPHCRVLAISTAGWDKASVAWEVRSIAEREADWYFSSRGQCASWIKPSWLAQQERTLPAHVYKRLHCNLWVDGAGAFFTSAEVDAIFQGVPVGPGTYTIGLDVGLSRDRTVIALLRVDAATGLVCVDLLVTYIPPVGAKVDLQEVEAAVAELSTRYQAPVAYDTWQAVLLGQRLEAQGIPTIPYTFTSESRRKLFGSLLDLIRTGSLRSRPHDDLRRELLGLDVLETSSGWRVDHKAGRHDDHVIAVALGIGAFWSEAVTVADAEQDAHHRQQERAIERYLGLLPTPPGGFNNLALDDDGRPIDRRYAGVELWFPPPPPEQGYVDMS